MSILVLLGMVVAWDAASEWRAGRASASADVVYRPRGDAVAPGSELWRPGAARRRRVGLAAGR
jgi:hypothetical protein